MTPKLVPSQLKCLHHCARNTMRPQCVSGGNRRGHGSSNRYLVPPAAQSSTTAQITCAGYIALGSWHLLHWHAAWLSAVRLNHHLNERLTELHPVTHQVLQGGHRAPRCTPACTPPCRWQEKRCSHGMPAPPGSQVCVLASNTTIRCCWGRAAGYMRAWDSHGSCAQHVGQLVVPTQQQK